MKIWILTILCAIGLLAGGCAAVSYAPVAYRQSGIDLGASPRVKLLRASDDSVLQKITANLAAELAKSGRVTLTDDKSDYWVLVNYGGNFRADDQAAVLYNQKIAKVSSNSGNVGAEVLTSTQNNSSAYGGNLNVTVYSVRNLSLAYHLNFAYLDSDFGPAAPRDQNAYVNRAVTEMTGRLDALFLTTMQPFDTAIVADADNELKNNVRNNRPDLALARARTVLPQSFDAFASAAQSGKVKQDNLETTLGNYYLLLVAEETQTTDPAAWQRLYASQQLILKLCSSDALAAASANALGRLEGKLALTGAGGVRQ